MRHLGKTNALCFPINTVGTLGVMSGLLGAVVGIAFAVLCLQWSWSYMVEIQIEPETPRVLWLVLMVVGCVTGAVMGVNLTANSLSLGIVTSLLIVQTPLDLFSHRLARVPTMLATVALIKARNFEVIAESRSKDLLVQSTVIALLLFELVVIHRWAPQSFGWGDILLVAPLATAVTSSKISSLAIWLFIASSSASFHGVMLRCKSGKRYIPFGPHLLGAAWLVLVFSL